MGFSFRPRLINPPLEDPGLLVPFGFERRAFLFDIGDIRRLSPRDILKISHIFISHTHVDHFFGFDYLLRICLGREKSVHVYGPEGIIDNVKGKLTGYTWNLLGPHTASLDLIVHEIGNAVMARQRFSSRDRFAVDTPREHQPLPVEILSEPRVSVSAIQVNHRIPCLAFRMAERFHVNILKPRLEELGLTAGPWLKQFKQALFEQRPRDTEVRVQRSDESAPPLAFRLGDLADRITTLTQGQKIAYVADTVFEPENNRAIVSLAWKADHLFIEGGFLHAHAEMARRKHHLTARQAGILAGRARVRQFTIFHFSPRYQDREHLLYEEARNAYQEEIQA